MEQFEVVFKPVEGYEHIAIKGENGELMVRLVPKFLTSSKDKAKYFTKITSEDRNKVKMWLAKQKGSPEWAKKFLKLVQKAVQVVKYDYWIANLEPSVRDEKIYYVEGEDVGGKYSAKDWKRMAQEYAPERGSRLAELYELILWYALRIVNGLWTLKYVAKNSSNAGNYWNAPHSVQKMEKTGARKCGGYRDGQGNSCKIVTFEEIIAIVGGCYCYDGDDYPVGTVIYFTHLDVAQDGDVGVVVLTK